jgi:hypothetical protein
MAEKRCVVAMEGVVGLFLMQISVGLWDATIAMCKGSDYEAFITCE